MTDRPTSARERDTRAPSLWARLLAALRGGAHPAPLPPAPPRVRVDLPFHVPLPPPSARGDATTALRAALLAFGRPHDVAAVDEACGVAADGSASIDALEEVARSFGIDAVQRVVPVEHLLLAEAALLPAIVVTRRQSSAPASFTLVWNLDGGRVQVLESDGSCNWVEATSLLDLVELYEVVLPEETVTAMLREPKFVRPLHARLRERGVVDAAALVDEALSAPGCRGLAALDATLRAAPELRDTALSQRASSALRGGVEELPPQSRHVREERHGRSSVRGVVALTLAEGGEPTPHAFGLR